MPPKAKAKPKPRRKAAPARKRATTPKPTAKPRKRAAKTLDEQRTERTSIKKARFVEALRANAGTVAAAARDAGIERRETAYDWRKKDPDFAEAWDDAMEDVTETAERELYRRAVTGIDKPVFYKGVVCAEAIREYSDTCLIFLLKSKRPEVYRDRQSVEHSGPDGGPIRTENVGMLDLTILDDEELSILERIGKSPKVD